MAWFYHSIRTKNYLAVVHWLTFRIRDALNYRANFRVSILYTEVLSVTHLEAHCIFYMVFHKQMLCEGRLYTSQRNIWSFILIFHFTCCFIIPTISSIGLCLNIHTNRLLTQDLWQMYRPVKSPTFPTCSFLLQTKAVTALYTHLPCKYKCCFMIIWCRWNANCIHKRRYHLLFCTTHTALVILWHFEKIA